MKNIKHKLLVMSGKGGVGKSTVALQIALGLKQLNFKVGLLDIDLCGPSIPTMLQIEDKHVYQCQEGWMPVYPDEGDQQFAVMSVGFFLKSRNDPVIWRGPKKSAMIKQLLNDVRWGDLDYLIIDTPPGTSDEHLAILQSLKDFGPCEAVLVTSPQIISVGEVRREITFCKKTQVKIIGIIENMSGYTCPHCSECTNLFSKEGGERLANYFNILFLGNIPMNIEISKTLDGNVGNDSIKKTSNLCLPQLFDEIIKKIVNVCDDNLKETTLEV